MAMAIFLRGIQTATILMVVLTAMARDTNGDYTHDHTDSYGNFL